MGKRSKLFIHSTRPDASKCKGVSTMRHIEPLDWKSINDELKGMQVERAAPEATRILADKINEMIEVLNKLEDKS